MRLAKLARLFIPWFISSFAALPTTRALVATDSAFLRSMRANDGWLHSRNEASAALSSGEAGSRRREVKAEEVSHCVSSLQGVRHRFGSLQNGTHGLESLVELSTNDPHNGILVEFENDVAPLVVSVVNKTSMFFLQHTNASLDNTADLLSTVRLAASAASTSHGSEQHMATVDSVIRKLSPRFTELQDNLSQFINKLHVGLVEDSKVISSAIDKVLVGYSDAIARVWDLCETLTTPVLSQSHAGVRGWLKHMIGRFRGDEFADVLAEITRVNKSASQVMLALDNFNDTAVNQLIAVIVWTKSQITDMEDSYLPEVLASVKDSIPSSVMKIVSKQARSSIHKAFVVVNDLPMYVPNARDDIEDLISQTKLRLTYLYEASNHLSSIVQRAQLAQNNVQVHTTHTTRRRHKL